MSDQTMYQRMVAKGIDMSWYTRNRHATDDAIPLYDETCNKSLSVYLLRTDGTLWTVNDSGSPHRKVRDTGKSLNTTSSSAWRRRRSTRASGRRGSTAIVNRKHSHEERISRTIDV